MVLRAGQYEAGGLGRASGHVEADAASKLNTGGLRGAKTMVSATTSAHGLFGDRQFPVWSLVSATGSSRRCPDLPCMVMFAQAAAPSVNPNWNARSVRTPSRARRPCRSSPAQKRIAEGDHRCQEVVEAFAGVEGEAGGLALGYPAQVDPGQIVGLLFGHQGRYAVLWGSAAPVPEWWPYSWASTIVIAMSP